MIKELLVSGRRCDRDSHSDWHRRQEAIAAIRALPGVLRVDDAIPVEDR
jgi:hypothetical protein